MPSIDAIVFDWGGVIADDPGDEFLMQLLREIGAKESEIEIIYSTYMRNFMRGEITEEQYWEMLRVKYNLVIHDTISHEFLRWRGLEVNNIILALADEARNLGIKTAILSNIIEPTYNVLAGTGHFNRFDEVVASCKIGYAKPQIEAYTYTLNKLDVTAEQTLFIDDKQKNIKPAVEMGFKTILANNPKQIISDIKQYLT